MGMICRFIIGRPHRNRRLCNGKRKMKLRPSDSFWDGSKLPKISFLSSSSHVSLNHRKFSNKNFRTSASHWDSLKLPKISFSPSLHMCCSIVENLRTKVVPLEICDKHIILINFFITLLKAKHVYVSI